jgi:hypothetical protein
MFNSLVIMTENVLLTFLLIALCMVILGENHPATKISHKDLCFQLHLHLPNFRVIIAWYIGVEKDMNVGRDLPPYQ